MAAGSTPASRSFSFHIPAQTLADALDHFGEQSGLQIIYDPDSVTSLSATAISGHMPVQQALDRLLAHSNLAWAYVNEATIAIRPLTAAAPAPPSLEEKPAAASTVAGQTPLEGIAELSEIEVIGDPMRVLPAERSSASFGFSKPLLETPRSVSFVSSEMIDLFGISATEDLPRVIPGAYTLTRYGIQGGIDIRDVAADIYFRGMKRLNMEGHTRTMLSAMDSIEAIKGPPSPIYGMGKIGGYINMVPKSGRAKTGGYLSRSAGSLQASIGSYAHSEFAVDVAGPLSFMNMSGGYSLFGLYENSDTFVKGVPLTSKMLQAAISLDNFLGPFRLETGFSGQSNHTAGAAMGRITQEVIDGDRYIRGRPLVNMDVNGNGSVGYLEQHLASPVLGAISGGNLPLLQNFALPADADGNPHPLNAVPPVKGIPQALYDYLVAHPEHDPTGLLRAQGPGGALPLSGYIPIGMFLDPLTTDFGTLDRRRFASFERDQESELLTLYADLIYDSNPDFTITNQFFFDSLNSYKLSDMGLYSPRDSYAWENKLTATRRIPSDSLPPWLQVNSLASVNFRLTRTSTPGGCFYNDYSANRTDVMDVTWIDSRGGMTPNTTFVSCADNPDLQNDGAPYTVSGKTRFWEIGIGALFDVAFFDRFSLLAGMRADGSRARDIQYAGTFNGNVGTSTDPGSFVEHDTLVKGWDQGTSWSLSATYAFLDSVRPYLTFAKSSVLLDNNSNRIAGEIIAAGHVGEAELREIGIKASLFGGKLYLAGSAYEQSRLDVSSAADPAALAEATSTISRGWEAELKWVPARNLLLAAYARDQKTVFSPNTGATIAVNARALGFTDIVDASGNVIYPAEAFLYGGRVQIVLPAGIAEYEEQQGRPNTQLGVNAEYRFRDHLGFSFSGNYLSSVYSGRLRLIQLPSSTTFNVGTSWTAGAWTAKIDVYNATNERSFRSQRLPSGEVLAIANPDRHWRLTLRHAF